MAGNLGTAYALSGRVAEALPLLEQVASKGRRGAQALWFARLSEAYLLAGWTRRKRLNMLSVPLTSPRIISNVEHPSLCPAPAR